MIGTGIDTDYSNNQDVNAVSPVIDLSLHPDKSVVLNFAMWNEFDIYDSITCKDDWVDLEVYDGKRWVKLYG